jgi:hypothetical protein
MSGFGAAEAEAVAAEEVLFMANKNLNAKRHVDMRTTFTAMPASFVASNSASC